MLTSFHPFRVNLIDQVPTDGIRFAKQGILPVDGAAITTYAGFFILRLERNASRASPLLRVQRSDFRRHGVDGNSIRTQLPDGRLHETVLVLATYAILPAPGVHACHIVFRPIFQRVATQADAQLATTM